MDRKNTLIGIFVIIILLAVSFFTYQFIFNKIKKEQEQYIVQPGKLTEEERFIKQQSDELDALRAQYQTQSTSSATSTLPTQIKTIDALKKKTTSIVIKKSAEQQAQELDALRSALNK